MLYNALNHMKAKQLGPGKFADGQGLWLVKRNQTHGKWILRLQVNQKRREMGLGRYPDVSIAEARERAAEARRRLRDGIDPIAERQKAQFRPERLTVADAIKGCFEARKADLKNDGAAGRWLSPLSVHVIPKIGKTAIEDVDQHVLKSILDPIWHKKPDVARKALNRMNLTLKHAAALGLEVDLQATMKTAALLGKQRHTVTNIPSLPYAETPAFYAMLCEKDTVAALALRFLILTVARTSEVRLATIDEIDGVVWTLPPERTKTASEHRIPLNNEALKIVEIATAKSSSNFLFPSPHGKALSDAAMSTLMRRAGYEARPHGFRATFRTWAENETEADWETKEMCLGHVVGSSVERAYQRSDRIGKRKSLLGLWSNFLNSNY